MSGFPEIFFTVPPCNENLSPKAEAGSQNKKSKEVNRTQSSRSKSLALTADGEVHTATIEMKTLRVTKGYAASVGLMFEKNTTGGSVIIQSIQFVTAEEAE